MGHSDGGMKSGVSRWIYHLCAGEQVEGLTGEVI